MTDAQMMTLALAVIIPLSMLIYSNSRITDTKEVLRAEMKNMHVEVMASLERIATNVQRLESSIEARIKVHELEHHR